MRAKSRYLVFISMLAISLLLFMNISAAHPTYVNQNQQELSCTRSHDYYTQLCLDYVSQNYTNRSLTIISSYTEMTEETNVSYTVVKVRWTLDDGLIDSVVVSINHDTLYIESGINQIQEDYNLYISQLPMPYPKTGWGTRKELMDKFGYLPSIGEEFDFLCSGYFWIYNENKANVIDLLDQLNYDYDDKSHFNNESELFVKDMTISDFLSITNSSQINRSILKEIYQSNNYFYLMTAIIIISASLIILVKMTQNIIKEKKRKRERDKYD